MNPPSRLRRTAGLTPGRPPARNTEIQKVSRRKKSGGYTARERRAIRTRLAEPWQGTPCWLAIPGLCTGAGEHWHELVGRAQGGSEIDPRNVCWACDACNGGLEARGDRYEQGWKVRAHDTVRGDGGLVPARLHPLSLAARRWV